MQIIYHTLNILSAEVNNHQLRHSCFYTLGFDFPDDGVDSLDAANIFCKYFSLKFCSNSQKPGTNNVPTIALTAMPNTTAVPRATREAGPAPDANNIGNTPNTNANAVIIIGLKRTSPALCAACLIGCPDLW